jgi:glutathione peroxidase
MTIRQRAMQWAYPLIKALTRIAKKSSMAENNSNAEPLQSFYELSAEQNPKGEIEFERLKGKKILIVNTASDCGLTPQYAELQKLWEEYKDKLQIVGFPANDFKGQEPGSDEEINQFCQLNYGVGFPIARKTTVLPGQSQHPVYQWLTDPGKNGWNSQAPTWNFSKYLIDENGKLSHVFDPTLSPLSPEVVEAVKKTS